MDDYSDDVMPNDGTYFMPREPQDQILARKKERALTLEATNILKDLSQRLQDRIEFYNSVDSIPDNMKTKPAQFMHLYSTYKLVRDTLIQEKQTIDDLIDTHSKR